MIQHIQNHKTKECEMTHQQNLVMFVKNTFSKAITNELHNLATAALEH